MASPPIGTGTAFGIYLLPDTSGILPNLNFIKKQTLAELRAKQVKEVDVAGTACRDQMEEYISFIINEMKARGFIFWLTRVELSLNIG